MEIRKNQLLLYSASHHVLNKPLHARDIFEHMLIRRADFRLDEDRGEEAMTHGQRFSFDLVGMNFGEMRCAERTVVIQVVEDAKVNSSPGAFVRDDDFSSKDEPCDGEGDWERHEEGGGIVDGERGCESDSKVGCMGNA